jgi:hypothetical protein
VKVSGAARVGAVSLIRAEPLVPPGVTGVAVLAIHNLAVHRLLPPRRFFGDQRLAEHGPGESTYHLVRIPLATALAEELQFRARSGVDRR